MSRSLNMIQIIGNAGKDPELRFTGNSTPVCTFSVATNDTATVDGEKKEYTQWHNCVAWRKAAEVIAEFLKKGSKVYIQGRMQYRTYDDKDGNKRNVAEIVVDQFVFLDNKKGDAPPAPESEHPA